TTSNPERERGCGGVTSVIFRYGVHIFCHTKTVLPIRCNEKQNGKSTKCELSPCQQKGVSKQDGIVEVPEDMHFDMKKRRKSGIWIGRHGILVPEETDCSGITSVKKKISFLSLISVNVTFQITNSRSRRRDRQEKRTGRKPLKEKTTGSPGKEKILTGLDLEMKEKGHLEEKATPQATLQAKYLPSGYARGNASAAGYAPGYASGNFKKIFALRLCLRLFLKKILPSGYASGKFKKIFALRLCPGATPQANFS
ncbi:hypothetical protein T09_4426, partial [Trichinella sp. T9]